MGSFAAGCILVGVMAACAGTPPSAVGSAAPSPTESPTTIESQPPPGDDPAAIAAARTAIEAADLADADTLTAIDAIRYTRAAAQAAADVLAAGTSGDARWAATWVYASAGHDPAPLRPLLDGDDDASVRAMAAAALLALGDRGGAETRAVLAASEDQLRGSRPPLSIAAYAAGSRARFIAGPSVVDDAPPAEVRAAWEAWLAEHGSTMTFDAATARWSASLSRVAFFGPRSPRSSPWPWEDRRPSPGMPATLSSRWSGRSTRKPR
jgi:hypothetical protein